MSFHSIRFFSNILIFSLALYAAIYGVSYAYRLHYLVNALFAWLFFIHLSVGPLSLARLTRSYSRSNAQPAPGSVGKTTKKRP